LEEHFAVRPGKEVSDKTHGLIKFWDSWNYGCGFQAVHQPQHRDRTARIQYCHFVREGIHVWVTHALQWRWGSGSLWEVTSRISQFLCYIYRVVVGRVFQLLHAMSCPYLLLTPQPL
jgi:hypothetical protein